MEDRLVEAYLGDKHDEILFPQKKYYFKTYTLSYFFGPVLFFYYRSYLVGFALLFLQGFINNILSSILHASSSTLNIMWACLYGYFTNTIYKWDVERKMKALLKKKSHLSESELLDIAEKKGRNNPFAMAIYILIYILFIVISIMSIINK